MHPINKFNINNEQGYLQDKPEENAINNVLLGIAQQSIIKDQKLEEKNQKYEKQIRLVVKENDGLKDQNLLLKEKITALESKLSDQMTRLQVEKENSAKSIEILKMENLELEKKLKPGSDKYLALVEYITELEKCTQQHFIDINEGGYDFQQFLNTSELRNFFREVYAHTYPKNYKAFVNYCEKKPILDRYKEVLKLIDDPIKLNDELLKLMIEQKTDQKCIIM